MAIIALYLLLIYFGIQVLFAIAFAFLRLLWSFFLDCQGRFWRTLFPRRNPVMKGSWPEIEPIEEHEWVLIRIREVEYLQVGNFRDQGLANLGRTVAANPAIVGRIIDL